MLAVPIVAMLLMAPAPATAYWQGTTCADGKGRSAAFRVYVKRVGKHREVYKVRYRLRGHSNRGNQLLRFGVRATLANGQPFFQYNRLYPISSQWKARSDGRWRTRDLEARENTVVWGWAVHHAAGRVYYDHMLDWWNQDHKSVCRGFTNP